MEAVEPAVDGALLARPRRETGSQDKELSRADLPDPSPPSSTFSFAVPSMETTVMVLRIVLVPQRSYRPPPVLVAHSTSEKLGTSEALFRCWNGGGLHTIAPCVTSDTVEFWSSMRHSDVHFQDGIVCTQRAAMYARPNTMKQVPRSGKVEKVRLDRATIETESAGAKIDC